MRFLNSTSFVITHGRHVEQDGRGLLEAFDVDMQLRDPSVNLPFTRSLSTPRKDVSLSHRKTILTGARCPTCSRTCDQQDLGAFTTGHMDASAPTHSTLPVQRPHCLQTPSRSRSRYAILIGRTNSVVLGVPSVLREVLSKGRSACGGEDDISAERQRKWAALQPASSDSLSRPCLILCD